MYAVRRLASDEWLQLDDRWNGLSRGVPFQRLEWLAPWWRHYRPGELCVLAVEDSEGRSVAYTPWYFEQTRGGGRVIRSLGSGEVCSDYVSILCRVGKEQEVARTLGEFLSRNEQQLGWDLIHLEGIDGEDPVVPLLLEQFSHQGHPVIDRPVHRCWRLPLPESETSLLALQSKSHRKQLRRFQTRIFDTQRGVLRRADSAESFEFAWNELVSLHQRRREQLGQPGCFASGRFAAFLREAAENMRRAGLLHLYWLELEGSPVAAEFHLAGPGMLYAYQSGIDPERLDEEPGSLITLAILRDAISECRQEIDFLRGDEPYKAHWRAVPRQAYDWRIVSRKASARIRHYLWRAADQARCWVKQGLFSSPSEPV